MNGTSHTGSLHVGDWVECSVTDRHGPHRAQGSVVELTPEIVDVLLEDGHHWLDRRSSGYITTLEPYLAIARRLHVMADATDAALAHAARRAGIALDAAEAGRLRAALDHLAAA